MNIKVKNVQYHRNGVGGVGFYVVHFTDTVSAKDMNCPSTDFVAVLFPGENDGGEKENGYCAVLNVGLLPNIQFGVNSWRGDNFEFALRKAVKKYQDKKTELYPEV